MRWIEEVVVLRPAGASSGLEAVNLVVSGGVRPRHVRQYTRCATQIASAPRRPATELVAANGVDVRLVEGAPEIAEAAQFLHDLRCVAREEGDGVQREEGATLLEPDRVREVVQRDQRLDTTSAQSSE